MATIVPAPPALSGELSLFHTTDPLLANAPVLVFYGPAATMGATSSRIQVHIFTPAGLGSYARLSVSPNSPFYTAVSNLPREEQGDEVCRGLAFGLRKYFAELSAAVKDTWCAQAKVPLRDALFGDDHVAILATRMNRVENAEAVTADITEAFGEKRLSWLDVDVVLPPGSIKELSQQLDSLLPEEIDEGEAVKRKYGRYANLVASLGEIAFLPTSKMRRAPSKASQIGRSASFLRHQKENVRKELNELLDTEKSYVSRLRELQEIQINALKESTGQNLAEVFPPSFPEILGVNGSFLQDLCSILESTNPAALHDIEQTQGTQSTVQQASQDFVTDMQGTVAVAKCLCLWFPQFAKCYRDYLQSQGKCSQSLRNLLRTADDPAANQLRGVGEQKLVSLLIEPVQRLPRYNLYIDSMVKQLPARHPALKPLLKARDMITDICAERQADEAASMTQRLRSRVLDWLPELEISGRLVTAVDYVDLRPPYAISRYEGGFGILLLFTDGIVMLEKSSDQTTVARTLLTEIESGVLAAESLSNSSESLRFISKIDLHAVQITESHEGQVLQLFIYSGMVPAQDLNLDCVHILRLENSYEGKAARFAEEVSKARVEFSFGESERERESSKWEFRSTDINPDSVGLLSALIEDSNAQHIDARRINHQIRVFVDVDRHAEKPSVGCNGIRTVVALSPADDGSWCVTFDSIDGSFGREYVETADIVPLLRRKLASLVGSRLTIDQHPNTAVLIRRNASILQSLELQVVSTANDGNRTQMAPPERIHRPKSPKKLLSNFLSSVGSGREAPSLVTRDPPAFSIHRQLSRKTSPPEQKPPSRESRPSSKDQATPSSVSSAPSTEQISTPLKRLEDTLAAYVLALHARKGNIVGRNLKMRASADELCINELYNGLLEDPSMMVLAAQAPVDALFAAFEKFLNIGWKEQMGSIVTHDLMQEIQSKAETMFPADFDRYFQSAFKRLAPQNQRAFKAIMKLLADLLDGTGNDGDRGILTAAFAEMLITDGNPQDLIPLIDRFVDDTETYFGEPLEDVQRTRDVTASSHKRSRSVNSGSLTSSTSSLRRKFGLGALSRENSKSEQESKVASVLRNFSKSSRGDASPVNSISKGTFSRPQSLYAGSRPSSQDGPKPSPFDDTPSLARPPSAHALGLSTIGEHPSFIPTGPPRKKRRSSLSDLKVLEASQNNVSWSPSTPRRSPLVKASIGDDSPSNKPKPLNSPAKVRIGSLQAPLQATSRPQLPTSFLKENSPVMTNTTSTYEKRPRSSESKPGEIVITTRVSSNIPSLVPRASSPQKTTAGSPSRTGLAERPGVENIVKKLSPSPDKATASRNATIYSSTGSPKKLRMQSPQKIRERLQNEQRTITAAQSSLQSELSKIGDELTASPSRRGSVRTGQLSTRGSISHNNNNSMDLAQRVLKMEGQLQKQFDEMNNRIASMQSDLTTSLTVSENKCRKLDELYREANGENEALYTRFNEELGRVLKVIRGGEGVEELKKKLKESQDDVAKLKRETNRLKRENVGLRAQFKE